MSSSDAILALCVTALTGNTVAGSRVFAPRDLPTWDGDLPVLFVSADDEDGSTISQSVGYPQFDVVTSVRVVGRVRVEAADDDAAGAQASAALGTLRDQIKRAVITDRGMMGPQGPVQAYLSFRARKEYGGPASNAHHAQVVVEFGIQHYQGPDDFGIDEGDDLEQIDVTTVPPSGEMDRDGLAPLSWGGAPIKWTTDQILTFGIDPDPDDPTAPLAIELRVTDLNA